MNLPNLLTLLRLFLVPVIFYALARGFFAVALVIFFAAAVTDALDGWIARHYHLQTRLGAVLDPVADKLLVVTTVITLTWLQRIPLWLTVAVISRDLLIVGGGLLYLLLIGKFTIHPTLLSKWNTALQFVVIVLVLFEASSRWRMPLLPVFVLVFVTAVASGGNMSGYGVARPLPRTGLPANHDGDPTAHSPLGRAGARNPRGVLPLSQRGGTACSVEPRG
ncbi:Putative CDP-diacylglycerol--glycerol-3-phosphate 3-phosphatidyl-transferase 2 [Acidithiobacillus ferridurans]|uniref:CDP-diacylglycerol--glycerol-3-phosphate 3-phosphatidyl-transferase 2 n=1 Tax=Acidithiobacillus ferridurans TaxID=1232575 RepID=A0A2Z6ILR9_ACIFI|nr:CDP-alcohol phosphatidyltransferase family protein [Acidithiobacillus ferridurans]BBF66650.1 Putative CDP-diacylglycerol--glycerol-3-phosphate 3-phosphatidyl-transferase 2 [Acidithiobacillus ferridurans]